MHLGWQNIFVFWSPIMTERFALELVRYAMVYLTREGLNQQKIVSLNKFFPTPS